MKYPKMTNVQMLVERSRPFWEARTGRSLCPVCSGSLSTGHPRILYNRDSFLTHWEAVHYSTYLTVSSVAGTELMNRILVGHSYYVLALGSRGV